MLDAASRPPNARATNRLPNQIFAVITLRAQHVFELLEFLALAHGDRHVARLEPHLSLRIELLAPLWRRTASTITP